MDYATDPTFEGNQKKQPLIDCTDWLFEEIFNVVAPGRVWVDSLDGLIDWIG